MKVFGINAGFDIIVKDDFWSVSVNANVNFFNIATLKVAGSFNSNGNVDFRMDGYIAFGSGGFGLFGDFHFHFNLFRVVFKAPFTVLYCFFI